MTKNTKFKSYIKTEKILLFEMDKLYFQQIKGQDRHKQFPAHGFRHKPCRTFWDHR